MQVGKELEIVRQVGYLLELYRDAWSPEYKKKYRYNYRHNFTCASPIHHEIKNTNY
jgi:hypothetical protein